MKKYLSIICAVAMICSLAGCSSSDSDSDSKAKSSKISASEAEDKTEKETKKEESTPEPETAEQRIESYKAGSRALNGQSQDIAEDT